MSLLRAFIAIEIPNALQEAIQAQTARLQKTIGNDLVRWVPIHNLHLTIKFLGDVSAVSVDIINQMLNAETGPLPCFSIQLAGLGSFPNARRPRVIWIGIQAPAVLESLYRGIDSASAQLGYESEARGFAPHLTFGRVKQNASATDLQKIRRALEEYQIGPIGVMDVDAVHLYKSDLKPGGSVYTRLYSAPLRQ